VDGTSLLQRYSDADVAAIVLPYMDIITVGADTQLSPGHVLLLWLADLISAAGFPATG
jgi:hypothetical protein